MSTSYVPASLLFIAAIFSALVAVPGIAGGLRQIGAMSDSLAKIVGGYRVPPGVPYAIAVLGICIGLVIGLIFVSFVGQAGWLIGAGLAFVGLLLPGALYVNGWDKRFVVRANDDAIIPLRYAHVLSGTGKRPVDEALRVFAASWSGESVLADLLLQCPSDESPVDFLGQLEIPGDEYTPMVVALQQAAGVPASDRARVLEQQLNMAFFRLKNRLAMMVKRRAQIALVVGVFVLLPTLMIAVLAPPMVNLVRVIGGW